MTNGTAGFIGIRVSPQTKAKLEYMAEEKGTSINQLLRRVVEDVANDSESLTNDAARRVAHGRVRQAVHSTLQTARHLSDQLSALEKLRSDLNAEVAQAREKGHFSFWDGNPDKKTQQQLDRLEEHITACDKRIRETRAALLGLHDTSEEQNRAEEEESVDDVPDEPHPRQTSHATES